MDDCHDKDEFQFEENPRESETLEAITDSVDTNSMAKGSDITMPSSNKAPVWKYFRFHKDKNTEKLVIENKAVCKLCFS